MSTTPDAAVSFILDALADNLHDLNDEENAPFGLYAGVEVNWDAGTMTVSPDPNADDWEDGVVPDGPVVRVTVERVR